MSLPKGIAGITSPRTLPAWMRSVEAALRQHDGRIAAKGAAGPQGPPGSAFIETYAEATGSSITVPASTFTLVPLSTEVSDIGGNYNPTTSIYTVPADGLYLCLAAVRVPDGSAPIHFALGIGAASDDAAWVKWQTSGGIRYSADYQRLATFTAGQQLRLYTYVAVGTPTFLTAALSIIRLA